MSAVAEVRPALLGHLKDLHLPTVRLEGGAGAAVGVRPHRPDPRLYSALTIPPMDLISTP